MCQGCDYISLFYEDALKRRNTTCRATSPALLYTSIRMGYQSHSKFTSAK